MAADDFPGQGAPLAAEQPIQFRPMSKLSGGKDTSCEFGCGQNPWPLNLGGVQGCDTATVSGPASDMTPKAIVDRALCMLARYARRRTRPCRRRCRGTFASKSRIRSGSTATLYTTRLLQGRCCETRYCWRYDGRAAAAPERYGEAQISRRHQRAARRVTPYTVASLNRNWEAGTATRTLRLAGKFRLVAVAA